VQSLLDLMAARDPSTRSHSIAVADLSVAIATALGVAQPQVRRVRTAALLHDVGKLGLPDAVLHKPAPLTEAEYALVERHPVWGHEIALGIGLGREALWILHHHERPDGRGYPHGLQGRAIPLESRILHVADAFDALTSDRTYRPAMTRRRALGAIVDGAGCDFDPECVAALTAAAARTTLRVARACVARARTG
jgi:putative nucleotidyltransferase with HDIG domain